LAFCFRTHHAAVNLFNFIDRYVPSAVKESIKTDLDLTDFQTSLPLSLFIVVYMLTSPIFGHLSDQGWSRKKLIAFGIAMWSLATALGAIAKSMRAQALETGCSAPCHPFPHSDHSCFVSSRCPPLPQVLASSSLHACWSASVRPPMAPSHPR
jgi:MFS family permease